MSSPHCVSLVFTMMKNDCGRKKVSALVGVRMGVQVYERFRLSSILIVLIIDTALETAGASAAAEFNGDSGELFATEVG